MSIWKWEYTRKVSVNQYGTPVYETVGKDEIEAATADAAKAMAVRLVKKIDPTIKAYPNKWRSAWYPCIYQFATAKDMHFTAFTKRPFYGIIDTRDSLDPWWKEEIRIEQI